MMGTILLIEDDPNVADLVAFHLERSGFEVRCVASAERAWDAVAGCDVVILDRMLPGASGLDFLKRLRSQRTVGRVPVLMLTARASEVDRVEGLEAGADDYLVKPFSAAELVARVRALLRRVAPSRRFEVGEIVIDVERAEVSQGEQAVELTRREFELLAFLAAHPGRVFSRGELLDRVWGEDFMGTERTVDQHVAQLRARFGEALIETIRGRGYRLAPPERTG